MRRGKTGSFAGSPALSPAPLPQGARSESAVVGGHKPCGSGLARERGRHQSFAAKAAPTEARGTRQPRSIGTWLEQHHVKAMSESAVVGGHKPRGSGLVRERGQHQSFAAKAAPTEARGTRQPHSIGTWLEQHHVKAMSESAVVDGHKPCGSGLVRERADNTASRPRPLPRKHTALASHAQSGHGWNSITATVGFSCPRFSSTAPTTPRATGAPRCRCGAGPSWRRTARRSAGR